MSIRPRFKLIRLVIWPGGWDQPFIANELVHRGIALELVQIRTGLNIGRTMARGTKIVGTPKAIKDEMEEMRMRVQRMKGEVIKDMQEGGSMRNMMRLGSVE